MKILVVHGPNLNLLGSRDPAIYGSLSLECINHSVMEEGKKLNTFIECFQSNIEGELIDVIQQKGSLSDGILINLAGYSHTSVALYDTLCAIKKPTVEVHLTHILQREEWRWHLLTARASCGLICGFGAYSYILGLYALCDILNKK